jgi:hypothetical protein
VTPQISATDAAQRDKAAPEREIAVGLAIVTMLVILGELAGRFGLRDAHLLMPALDVASLVAFVAGRLLEHRRPLVRPNA